MRKPRQLCRLLAVVTLVLVPASLTPTASEAQSERDVKTSFQLGEQFADLAGQPELKEAAEGTEKLLELFGVLGNDQDAKQATDAALKTLGTQIGAVENRLKAQQVEIDKFAQLTTFSVNQALITQTHNEEQAVMALQVQLAPPAAASEVNCDRYRKSQGCAPPPPAVTPQQAAGIAKLAYQAADEFVDNQPAYWKGEDLETDVTANPSDPQHPIVTKNPVDAFKPYPALEVYLHALSIWVLAMEVEAQGDYPSIMRKYGARGGELDKHIAFLTWLENGDTEKPWPGGIVSLPHTLANQIRCQEVVGSQYPDSSGQCHAKIVCQDAIDRTSTALPQADTWYQQDRNSLCQGNPAVTSLHPQELDLARSKYHTDAIDAMRGLLLRVKETGTAHVASNQPAGSVAGSQTEGSQLVIYGVGRLGEVSWYSKDGPNDAWSGPVVVAQGWRNLTALVPAGGSDFFSVNSLGFLNVVTLGGSSKAVGAPVQLGSGWNAYQSVFGGGDGVLYAIAKDGTLLWFRRGPGGSLQGPVTVGSGWGGFGHVFSAGQGVIYAVKPDGALVWYRHTDYLTGVSGGGRETRAGAAQPHWEGPVTVGSGWNVFPTIVPAGGGVVLAVRPDGALLWYKHEDYLTGISRPGMERMGGVAQPVPHWNGPVVIGSAWNQFIQVSAALGNSQGSGIR